MLNRTAPMRQYGTVQTVQKTVRNPTRKTANYMNVKIHNPELEARLRRYCEDTDRSMNSVMNEAIAGFFSVSSDTDAVDIGERYKLMIAIFNHINLDEFQRLLDIVRQDTLSRNAKLSDLVSSAISEGFASLKSRYEST